MFAGPFIKCSADESDDIIAALDTCNPGHGFRAAGLALLRKTLEFYGDAFYYEMTQADQHPSRTLHLVVTKKLIFVCDGVREQIENFNRQCPLILNQNLVLDYVRFYFAHVSGPHGISAVIDTVEDLQLREEPTPALRKALDEKIVPLGLNASIPGGGYQVRGTILIRQTLYNILADIDAAGVVEPQIGRVLADLLPVEDRALEG